MFVAFTLLLLWLFQVVFLESFYKNIKVNDVKAAATDIAKSYNGDNIETVLEQITQKNDVFVIVADETGKLLYSSGLSPVNVVQYMSASSLQSLIATAKDNGGTYLLRFGREESCSR
jgi:alanyl-tRNA synthetase